MSPMEIITQSSGRLFVFTDLDDTLFASPKSDEVTENLTPATVDVNGDHYAYSSIQQQKLLNIMIKSDATIIPVTGRRSSSFLNCRLPCIMNSLYSVVSHGAVILDHQHQLLNEWVIFLEQQFNLTQWQARLTTLHQRLFNYAEKLDSGIRVRLIVDQGITTYLCIKINKENAHQLALIELNDYLQSILPADMLLHANGRNFAILPPYAQKKVAVDFLKQKMNVGSLDTVLGIGDSHSDLAFMQDSDFLIVPQKAQIFEKK